MRAGIKWYIKTAFDVYSVLFSELKPPRRCKRLLASDAFTDLF